MAERYRRAGKREKGRILDDFLATSGYKRRKYAIWVLCGHRSKLRQRGECGAKRGRPALYDEPFVKILIQVWYWFRCMCGKRLAAVLRVNLEQLEKFGELHLDARMRGKLLAVAPATIDRLLRVERQATQFKGRSHTKPGSLRKAAIPIRTFADWNEKEPGFVEIDLVAHDGGNGRGDFAQTLNLTDVHTCWTEPVAVQNKAQKWVFAGLQVVKSRLPFPLKGIDSDNGAEFINNELMRYCKDNLITFTRSRPYRKNDNCFVEQKNWTVVRQTVLYARYQTPEELQLLNQIYGELRLLVNFFYPTTKLLEKTRIGSKVRRRYDTARTPYQRVLESAQISDSVKRRLRRQFAQLNPVAITRRMNRLQDRLEKTVVGRIRRASAAGQPLQEVG